MIRGPGTASLPLGSVPSGQLVRVDVQLAAAKTSSLDYVALAEFTGEAAARYFDLRRAMQRLLLQACSSNGWTIPFPQLVVHRPGP